MSSASISIGVITLFGFILTTLILDEKTTYVKSKNIIFESFFDKPQQGFNSWEGGSWNGIEAAHPYSITISKEQVRVGIQSAKFILNKTDKDRAGSKRAELTDYNGRMLNPKSERWYGLSIFLPKSFIVDPCEEILFQWHAINDGNDKDNILMSNPPLAMMTQNGKWIWSQKFGGKVDLGVYKTGVWTDWVLRIKFSPDDLGGIIEIWKNGHKVFFKTGKNTYNDIEGNYFKMGIYKFGWKERYKSTTNTRILYFDQIRIGNANSSYNEVNPGQK